jgi:hypothetical protein
VLDSKPVTIRLNTLHNYSPPSNSCLPPPEKKRRGVLQMSFHSLSADSNGRASLPSEGHIDRVGGAQASTPMNILASICKTGTAAVNHPLLDQTKPVYTDSIIA